MCINGYCLSFLSCQVHSPSAPVQWRPWWTASWCSACWITSLMPSFTASVNQVPRCSCSPAVRPSSCCCCPTSDTWGKDFKHTTIQNKQTQKHCLCYSHANYIYFLFFFSESNKGMEHLYRMKCKNRVPLYDLLLEMLDAQRFHSSGKVQRPWAQSEKYPPSTPTTSSSSPSRGPGAMLPNTACHDQSPDPWAVYNPTNEDCEAVRANLSNSFWR